MKKTAETLKTATAAQLFDECWESVSNHRIVDSTDNWAVKVIFSILYETLAASYDFS